MLFACYDGLATPGVSKFASTGSFRSLLDIRGKEVVYMSTTIVDHPLQPGERAPNVVLDAISREGKVALDGFSRSEPDLIGLFGASTVRSAGAIS